MKCYLRRTLTDLRDTKVQKSLNCSQLCELPAHTSRFNLTNYADKNRCYPPQQAAFQDLHNSYSYSFMEKLPNPRKATNM